MRHLSILIVFVLIGYLTSAQVVSTMGRDFWVAFLPNSGNDLSLLVSGDHSTTGQVSTASGFWSCSFTVTPGLVTTIHIPDTFQHHIEEEVMGLGLHVTTQASVSLYASNYASHTYDNTNVLPTVGLKEHYVLQTMGETIRNNEFCVVAVQDSTLVYINTMVNSAGGRFLNGITDSVMLNTGETFMVQSSGDLSGTEVWTEECKPFAVFVGNECAYVPSNCVACDHLYEQAVPTEYWGTRFGIVASKTRTFDIIKITALENNTMVRSNNTTLFTLAARQSREIEVRSLNGDTAIYLRTTKPVSVSLYLTGTSCGGTHGDPSATIIHPIEEKVSHVTFATFSTDVVDSHFVNIVTKDIYSNDIYLDNQQLSPSVFRPLLGSGEYVYAQINVEHGVHSLRSNNGGFVSHVYGLGLAESYAYSVGASLDPINPYSLLNGIPFSLYDSTNNVFCIYDTLFFTSEVLKSGFTTVLWDFGDGTVKQGINVFHNYSQPGNYTVRVRFSYVDECMKITSYQQSMSLVIASQQYSETDTIVCGSVCNWNGQTFDSAGTYNVYFPVGETCDSIARLNIEVLSPPPQPTIESEYVCQHNQYILRASGDGSYILWHSIPDNHEIDGFERDSVITVTPDTLRTYFLYMAYESDSSCGTEISLPLPKRETIKAKPTADRNVLDFERPEVVLMDKSVDVYRRVWYADGIEISTSPWVNYSFPLNNDSVVIMLVVYDNLGCSDSATLTLHIMRDGIYVPNIIAPSLSENSRFKVYGENLIDGEIWIYNRGGQQVWYTNNIFDSWDGTKDGMELPSGCYVYTILYRRELEPKILLRKTGTVTVVR